MLAEVEHLDLAMQELLALLADSEADGVPAAWQRCQQAEQALIARVAESAELSEAEREDLRADLDRLMRLNAIARQAVLRQQDGLARTLVDARQKQSQVRAYSTGGAKSGGSCDMAG